MRRVSVAVFGALAGALLSASVPARADILINISKAQQQLTVTVDGTETYRWPVSTGKPGYDTPSGNFQAFRLEEVYFSKKYDDAPMPNAVFFHGGYAVHGTYEQSRLGRPVSHGCVRLSRANAATLFALVREQGPSRTHIVISDARLVSRLPDPSAEAVVRAKPPEQQTATRESAPLARIDSGFGGFGAPADRPAFRPDTAVRHAPKPPDARGDVDRRNGKAFARRVIPETRQLAPRERAGFRIDPGEARMRALYRKYGFKWEP